MRKNLFIVPLALLLAFLAWVGPSHVLAAQAGAGGATGWTEVTNPGPYNPAKPGNVIVAEESTANNIKVLYFRSQTVKGGEVTIGGNNPIVHLYENPGASIVDTGKAMLAMANELDAKQGYDVRVQLECLPRQMPDVLAYHKGQFQDFGSGNVFVQVPPGGLVEGYAEVCKADGSPAEDPTLTKKPNPKTTPTTPKPDKTKTCHLKTVMEAPAEDEVTIPASCWALVEVVDNGGMAIDLSVVYLTEPMTSGIEGAVHTTMWGYSTRRGAMRGLWSQLRERQDEAAEPDSWNEDYLFTVEGDENVPESWHEYLEQYEDTYKDQYNGAHGK
jgi:hypothetical protein